MTFARRAEAELELKAGPSDTADEAVVNADLAEGPGGAGPLGVSQDGLIR
jgi:hypothetical protein